MKKLLLGLLVAFAVALPDAHARYEGILKSGQPVTITLTPNGTTATATVVTAKKRKLAVLGLLTALPLGPAELAVPSLPPVQRLIISVNVPLGGTAMLHVVQGAVDNQATVSQDTDFVYDVTP